MGDTDKLQTALARMSLFDRVLRIIPVAAPIAGAEVITSVPGGVVWRPLSFITTLVTSAAVANRQPSLVVDDSTTTVMRLPQSGVQAASLTVVSTWANGYDLGGGSAVVGVMATSFPDMALPAGYRLRTLTGLIDVADQYGASALWVEEVLSQPQGVHEAVNAGREYNLIATSLASEAQ